jgi:invasion protein IalB
MRIAMIRSPLKLRPEAAATYDDWIVRCETLQGRASPQKLLMVQYTQAKGGQGVISQVAIGRVTKSDPIKLVVQLPIGIWLPTGVKIVRRCQGSGLAGNLQALHSPGLLCRRRHRE